MNTTKWSAMKNKKGLNRGGGVEGWKGWLLAQSFFWPFCPTFLLPLFISCFLLSLWPVTPPCEDSSSCWRRERGRKGRRWWWRRLRTSGLSELPPSCRLSLFFASPNSTSLPVVIDVQQVHVFTWSKDMCGPTLHRHCSCSLSLQTTTLVFVSPSIILWFSWCVTAFPAASLCLFLPL